MWLTWWVVQCRIVFLDIGISLLLSLTCWCDFILGVNWAIDFSVLIIINTNFMRKTYDNFQFLIWEIDCSSVRPRSFFWAFVFQNLLSIQFAAKYLLLVYMNSFFFIIILCSSMLVSIYTIQKLGNSYDCFSFDYMSF